MRYPHRQRSLAAALLPALSILLLAACASAAFGQSPDRSGVSPGYGTTSRILYHVGFADFAPESSVFDYFTAFVNSHQGRFSDSSMAFLANPHLPSGALLTYLEFDYCDTNTVGSHLGLDLENCDFLGANCQVLAHIPTAFVSGSGCTLGTFDLTSQNITFDNNTSQLVLRASVSSHDETNVLLGAYIGYRLQVSAAPAVATFTDVPTTSPQFKFVEALVAAGVTAGCGGGHYCPDSPITRGQMAVFLASALGLHFPN